MFSFIQVEDESSVLTLEVEVGSKAANEAETKSSKAREVQVVEIIVERVARAQGRRRVPNLYRRVVHPFIAMQK